MNEISLDQVRYYHDVVIPKLKEQLKDESKDQRERIELYYTYVDVLRLIAPHDFDAFNEYLELDEDKTESNRGFHYHRREHLREVWESLNDMEIYDKYDIVLISLIPRGGKTQYGIRFLSWIIGRNPEFTQMATSYSESITASFYNGIMEIVQSERFREIFPESPLVNQNAKRQEIWLRRERRYPSIILAPVRGSVTGRAEANNYLYVDDLVSGTEEALSFSRLEKLWTVFTGDFYQRKKQDCKMIMIATRWSVHDPITRIERMNEGNPRCKNIKIPATNEYGESNFDFPGGFNSKFFEDMKKVLDPISYNALYMQDPVEREGLLYNADELLYFFDLPDERPDTVIAVCDSKNMGTDFVASPIGVVYGDMIYITDVVYNNGLPEVTRPLVADAWLRNNVVRADVELNNGGNYYAEDLNNIIKSRGGNVGIKMFFSGNNKNTKIITYSDFIKKNFVFRDPSTYPPNSEYAKFMNGVLTWTQTGKNPHDDAPDSLAMLAQLFQDLSNSGVKILSRRDLKI